MQNPGANQTFVPAPAGALPANEITQLQANFSLFWGLAVQLYESSLVSDQTPVDKFLGGDQSALTKQEIDGMGVFTGKGQCSTPPRRGRADERRDRGGRAEPAHRRHRPALRQPRRPRPG